MHISLEPTDSCLKDRNHQIVGDMSIKVFYDKELICNKPDKKEILILLHWSADGQNIEALSNKFKTFYK
jgi:hypothetical protein